MTLLEEYFRLGEFIKRAQTDAEKLRYAKEQLGIADRVFSRWKKKFRNEDEIRYVEALSPDCVSAAVNLEPDLLIQMAELINRHPSISEEQATLVRRVMQEMGMAK